jgi:septum site-determining protein MinD
MGKVITIASAKGGVGKTTIAANLGCTLAMEFGKSVLLIDGNLTGANLAYHFGINYPKTTIADFNSRLDIPKIIYSHFSGVRIIPGPVEFERIDPRKLKKITNIVKKVYDIVLIDSPPGLGKDAITTLKVGNEILDITTPDIPSVVCTKNAIELAKRFGKKVKGLVVNKVKNKKFQLNTEDILSLCEKKILANIPESNDFYKALSLQKPLVIWKPNSKISIEFKKLAAYVLGVPYEPKSIIYRIKRLLGFKEKEMLPSKTKIKEIQKAKMVEEILSEVLDIENLRTELLKEVKTEFKEQIRKEVIKKLKERLSER